MRIQPRSCNCSSQASNDAQASVEACPDQCIILHAAMIPMMPANITAIFATSQKFVLPPMRWGWMRVPHFGQ
ncbi:MAG: hypothetical protein O7B26_10430 [Planctomycetota bacterium]|nr:hypothetical protein [Planctomycetota bacterium]